MNLQRLRAFRSVMQRGSVTAAADELHLSQPAVSKLVAALEHELGFAIFTRTGGRLAPTAAGEAFLRAATRVLVGIDDLAMEARDLRENKGRRLRLLASPQLCYAILPPVMAAFRRRWPSVRISVKMQHAGSETDIDNQDFDLCVSAINPGGKVTNAERGTSLSAVAVMRRGHPLSERARIHVADLDGVPLIRLLEGHALRARLDMCFFEAGLSMAFQHEASSALIACRLAATSDDIAIVDRLSPLVCPPQDLAVLPFEPEVRMPYGFFYPYGIVSQDPMIEEFANEIRKRILIFDSFPPGQEHLAAQAAADA